MKIHNWQDGGDKTSKEEEVISDIKIGDWEGDGRGI